MKAGGKVNGKKEAAKQISDFLNSKEKCMLLTGTHQYEKHKIIMSILDRDYEKLRVLFRTNSMKNTTDREFLGFAGVNKQLKSGERRRIGKNIYEADSFNLSSSWLKTSHEFNVAIFYPIDAIVRDKATKSIDNLFEDKSIEKIFLVSWTDQLDYDYDKLNDYYSRHVIYDSEEENPEYHERLIKLLYEQHNNR